MTYQRIAMASGSEAEDEAHRVRHDLVDGEEEQSGDEHHDEDHRRGDAGLFPGRPGHARHFLPHLPKKLYWTGLRHGSLFTKPVYKVRAAPDSKSRAAAQTRMDRPSQRRVRAG